MNQFYLIKSDNFNYNLNSRGRSLSEQTQQELESEKEQEMKKYKSQISEYQFEISNLKKSNEQLKAENSQLKASNENRNICSELEPSAQSSTQRQNSSESPSQTNLENSESSMQGLDNVSNLSASEKDLWRILRSGDALKVNDSGKQVSNANLLGTFGAMTQPVRGIGSETFRVRISGTDCSVGLALASADLGEFHEKNSWMFKQQQNAPSGFRSSPQSSRHPPKARFASGSEIWVELNSESSSLQFYVNGKPEGEPIKLPVMEREGTSLCFAVLLANRNDSIEIIDA